MVEQRPERSESDRPAGEAQPCVQFGVRDLLVLMLFTALALGTYRVDREWLPLIAIAFVYYLTRCIRWRRHALPESSPSAVGRSRVTVLTRLGAVFSGVTNGVLLALLLFVVVASMTGVKIPFTPLIAAGAGLGLVLGFAFPRFFSRFWLPWPF